MKNEIIALAVLALQSVCAADVKTSCLPCFYPTCPPGTHIFYPPPQANGCPGCPKCVQNNSSTVICPAMVCPSGTYAKQTTINGCDECVDCPALHCPFIPSECDEGYYLQNATLTNGCASCPSCERCPELFCKATVCEPGKTYPQIGTRPNGCSGCPTCVPCQQHVCPLIYCQNMTSTTDENGCPGCPRCNFTPINLNATTA